jgi:hypothetical protein
MSNTLATPAVVAVDARLDQLAALGPNWDGSGAPAIDRPTLTAARTWVRRLPEWALSPPPAAVPLSSEALQFEWHSGGRVLEIEFESPAAIHFLKWDPAAGVQDEATYPATDFARSEKLIAWAVGGPGRG